MTRKWKAWRAGLVTMALLSLALSPWRVLAGEPGPTGEWLRDNGTVRIAVNPCGNRYCAVNVWVKRPDGPEKVGDELILNMRPVSAGDFRGTAYDVRRHLTYRMTILLQGNHMKTSGCVLFGMICRSTGWERVAGANATG